jgi:hypothetical protein
MVHLGHPADRGCVIVEAWRTEELFRSCQEQVLGAARREAGLAAGEPEIGPAWSIASPSTIRPGTAPELAGASA